MTPADLESLKATAAKWLDPEADIDEDPMAALDRMIRAIPSLVDALASARTDLGIASARAGELRTVLTRLEWSFRQTALRNGGTIYTAELCPACMGERNPPDDKGSRRLRGDPLPPAGHKPGCWLAAALEEETDTP